MSESYRHHQFAGKVNGNKGNSSLLESVSVSLKIITFWEELCNFVTA